MTGSSRREDRGGGPGRWHSPVMSPAAMLLFGLCVALAVVCTGTGAVAGQGAAAGPTSLLAVRLVHKETLAELERVGWTPYAHVRLRDGEYLFVGAQLPSADVPAVLGTGSRVLDADISGATYYWVYPAPYRPLPDWAQYGRVLLDDGTAVLLRISEREAESLAEQGADIVRFECRRVPLRFDEGAAALGEGGLAGPDPDVLGMVGQVTSDRLRSYTGDLSGEWQVSISGQPYTIRSRYTYSGDPIQKATCFVGQHLEALGLDVEYHVWNGSTHPNVIGQLAGRTNPEQVYILCAHLDDMPSGSVAPGADDNASGVSAVLVAADILTQYSWDSTLRFAFWTGEEQGLRGSDAYAARARSRGEDIRGVLNLDMIAYNTAVPELNLFAKSSVPGSQDISGLFVDVVGAYGLSLTPVPYVNDSLGERSDNKSFWDEGYAAILAIEDYYGDFNNRYHTTEDRLGYLDMGYFTELSRAAVGTFAHLAGLESGTPPEPTPTATTVPLSASAAADPTGGQAPLLVRYTGSAEGGTPPYSYAWDLGDGQSATQANPTHTYEVAADYAAVLTISDAGGSQASATVAVTVSAPPTPTPTRTMDPGAIDFHAHSLQPYAGQDHNPTVTIEDGGATLHLVGNGWKKISLPYVVTSRTMLELDYRSGTQGEVHGIGFDNDDSLSSNRVFQLYGTQSLGLNPFRDYATAAPQWKHYTIPVGKYVIGSMRYLTFVNDHDVSKPTAESLFSNVRVYDTVPPEPTPTPTSAPPMEGPFVELNGQVVMEAEHYTRQQPGTGSASTAAWQSTFAYRGYVGSAAVQALPNRGVSTGLSTNGPALVFEVQFQTSGNYYAYVRGYAPTTSTENDSVHVGLDGVAVTARSGAGLGGFRSWWFTWQNHANGYEDTVVRIPAPGLYSLYLWMREDGTVVDRIWLSTQQDAVANGSSSGGPAESPRGR